MKIGTKEVIATVPGLHDAQTEVYGQATDAIQPYLDPYISAGLPDTLINGSILSFTEVRFPEEDGRIDIKVRPALSQLELNYRLPNLGTGQSDPRNLHVKRLWLPSDSDPVWGNGFKHPSELENRLLDIRRASNIVSRLGKKTVLFSGLFLPPRVS